MFAAGEQAAYQVGIHGLHPELIKLLGRLKYRTSYGQNVLGHSIEVASVCGMIASELGANVTIAKKAGLLQTIGKAVDREVEGTHAGIGADLVKQWDKSKDVVRGVAEHHMDGYRYQHLGLYRIGSRCHLERQARPPAARAWTTTSSGSRASRRLPTGSGRREILRHSAGREVRILVKPEEVDDLSAMRLARDIVKKIEESLTYPGQIKVTVIRETRATDFAK